MNKNTASINSLKLGNEIYHPYQQINTCTVYPDTGLIKYTISSIYIGQESGNVILLEASSHDQESSQFGFINIFNNPADRQILNYIIEYANNYSETTAILHKDEVGYARNLKALIYCDGILTDYHKIQTIMSDYEGYKCAIISDGIAEEICEYI